jgi:hypothetical protein
LGCIEFYTVAVPVMVLMRLLTANALRKGLSFWKSSMPDHVQQVPKESKGVTEREVVDPRL